MKRTIVYSERIIFGLEESKRIVRDFLKARGEWRSHLDIRFIHSDLEGFSVTLVPVNPEQRQDVKTP